jgi:hypothetical protein
MAVGGGLVTGGMERGHLKRGVEGKHADIEELCLNIKNNRKEL